MRKNIIALMSLSFTLLALTGCDKGTAQMQPDETNVLGIVKIEDENYSPAGQTTFDIATDDLYVRNNFEGKKVSLLWGLVTIRDY